MFVEASGVQINLYRAGKDLFAGCAKLGKTRNLLYVQRAAFYTRKQLYFLQLNVIRRKLFLNKLPHVTIFGNYKITSCGTHIIPNELQNERDALFKSRVLGTEIQAVVSEYVVSCRVAVEPTVLLYFAVYRVRRLHPICNRLLRYRAITDLYNNCNNFPGFLG